MNSICKACGMVDTAGSNGDIDWCNDCHSVEQGFIYVTEYEHDSKLVIDEDGLIYREDEELDGPVASEWR